MTYLNNLPNFFDSDDDDNNDEWRNQPRTDIEDEEGWEPGSTSQDKEDMDDYDYTAGFTGEEEEMEDSLKPF